MDCSVLDYVNSSRKIHWCTARRSLKRCCFFVADGLKLVDLQWIILEALDLHHGHQDAWSSVFKKLCFF